MKISQSRRRGFTLIELMIVVAIIAILTAVLLPSIARSRSKARDTKRVSDVSQIQLAVEQFFDRCGQYPTGITDPDLTNIKNGCPSGITLASFISKIPAPSSAVTNQTFYDYQTNVMSAGMPTDYILHAKLENQIDSLSDSLPESFRSASDAGATASWHCYTGGVSVDGNFYDYCVGPK